MADDIEGKRERKREREKDNKKEIEIEKERETIRERHEIMKTMKWYYLCNMRSGYFPINKRILRGRES